MTCSKIDDLYDYCFLKNLKYDDHYVYHYTSLDTYMNYIAPSGALRFSKFSESYDAFENMRSIFALENRKWVKSPMTEIINKPFRFACFSQGDRTNPDNIIPGYLLARMWAQYGGKHKGICLAFDKTQLLKEIADNFGSITFFVG